MNKQDFLNRFIMHNPKAPLFSQLAAHSVIHLSAQQEKKTTPFKKAAVLMPLVQRKNGLHVIFTQRALHLKHHAGQISFPGGKHEISDRNLAHTALRETEEEIGLKQETIQIVGSLSSLKTVTGYHITPFIGFVKPEQKIIIDHNEVKECFEVPFSYILNQRNFSKHNLVTNKNRHTIYCCAFQHHLIWGATAQMLITLQKHLNSANLK